MDQFVHLFRLVCPTVIITLDKIIQVELLNDLRNCQCKVGCLPAVVKIVYLFIRITPMHLLIYVYCPRPPPIHIVIKPPRLAGRWRETCLVRSAEASPDRFFPV